MNLWEAIMLLLLIAISIRNTIIGEIIVGLVSIILTIIYTYTVVTNE